MLMKNYFNNRVKFLGLMLSIFMFVLIGRLYNLSIMHSADYTSRVERQLQREMEIYYPRGKILDRNSIPFTGKNFIREDLTLPSNIEKDILASHVIGQLQYQYKNNTVNGLKGVSGIQKLFDQELNGGLPIKITQYKDGWGQKISEDNYYVYGDHVNQGKNVRLTLDYHIQKNIEEAMESFLKDNHSIEQNNKLPGIAITVMDIENGEVLGMASMGDQNNKSLHSFPVGSVLKTLVAAKALEEGVVDLEEEFICNGTIMIEGIEKHCHKTEGHGNITFKEAFAQSCNSVFFEVAHRLTEYNPNGTIKGNKIIDLAKEFGFSPYSEKKKDSFVLADKYSCNTLPDSITGQMDIFNLALGQGVIEANPLMTTKIMATIANEGIFNEPTMLMDVSDSEGEVIKSFEKAEGKKIFEEDINRQLQTLLEEVSISGTAKNYNLVELGGIAGKTGTAQGGQIQPHSWFAGYFPVGKPKYAMTVFIENGGSGSQVAVPLFQEAAEKILKLGQRN
ncbi:penicillin-binding transpeptidase domain-containing protein [Irregularibacter muris]|uniref:Penicillin-binding transpeptidase domain-containing protein n=1 Tax=Irregularibacter muris TaxID=1796619 RepID=A0AAE3HEG2_9FIRM|nr:penicillin-binding transpeptidase domain-containing protein [Irregularibacter muris]MCR1897967.1 penicillin-binding transpeptidase domain-containing protein [Irregularibacter muris]